MKTLTARQQQILDLIRACISEDGMPPTRAEIARRLGFSSPNAAEAHLKALARKGFIDIVPGLNRNIRLRQEHNIDPDALPLVGRVAAGAPILAQEHIEGRYRFDSGLFRPRPDYLLRVHGMSMRDAGILDGDLLAVHRTPEAFSGQIVVARLDDEVTVKRLQRRDEYIRLLPANPEFTPIEVNPAQTSLVIEGVAVGVIRNGRL